VIFLDLEEDRYFCLSTRAEAAFRRAVAQTADQEDHRLLQSVLASRAAIDVRAVAETPLLAKLPPPSRDFLADAAAAPAIPHVLEALAAQTLAAWQLRRSGLGALMRRVRARARGACPEARGRAAPLQAICASYARAALVIPAADHCLVRAVALHAACCRVGIAPHLVFGVQIDPFRAHAWVQLEDKVLVGDFEQVRLFTPIALVG
jgi:hypothetical protein